MPDGYEDSVPDDEDPSSSASLRALHKAALENWRSQTSQASRIYPREFGYSMPLSGQQDMAYFPPSAPVSDSQTNELARMVEHLASRLSETLMAGPGGGGSAGSGGIPGGVAQMIQAVGDGAAVADSVAAPVEGLAQTASRWSNIATEGLVNGANFMNNVNHRMLDRFLDVMQVADRSSRAVAYSETDLMRRILDSQMRFLDSVAGLNERMARRGSQIVSRTTESLAEAGVSSIDLPTLLDAIVIEDGGQPSLYI